MSREYYICMSWEDHGIEKYPDYFETDWWFDLKWKHIFGNSQARCFICASMSKLLLHHVSYVNLFKEKLERDIYILCFDCHNQAHFWTIFKIKIPLTTNWLLFSMRARKAIFYTQSGRFGLSLLWFLTILIISLINIVKFLLKTIVVLFFKLVWIVLLRKTLYNWGLDISKK